MLARLIAKRYRARHVRRRYIDKGGGKLRPLGIPALEDKIVQLAASKLLQAIYEADFLDESKGYRSNRGARDASQELRERLVFERVHWVVEADIKGFFENVDHDWLERMLRQRRSFNWCGFSEMWKTLAIPNPRIVEKPYHRDHTWKLSYR